MKYRPLKVKTKSNLKPPTACFVFRLVFTFYGLRLLLVFTFYGLYFISLLIALRFHRALSESTDLSYTECESLLNNGTIDGY